MNDEPGLHEPRLRQISVPQEADGQRLDLFLVQQLDDVSRSRAQLLLEQGSVLIGGKLGKASRKVRGGESISILGDPQPPPLRAMAEVIPLEIVYEDGDLAVVNKPAGMMVHAGSGATDDARNRGTLVNALLHHMRELSSSSGPLRPGIVHRLDKQTSGLIVVAKNDVAHARLASMFSRRQVRKLYLTLVQGELPQDSGTVNASISRDTIRRTRMTTRREGGRSAVSHWQVLRRIRGPYGSFTLASVRIETGRTHQIRVHMASLGHPVVGDTLYGASTAIVPLAEFARLPRLALQSELPACGGAGVFPPGQRRAHYFGLQPAPRSQGLHGAARLAPRGRVKECGRNVPRQMMVGSDRRECSKIKRASMTKMKACWRLAASVLGFALLVTPAALVQTTPPAPPNKDQAPATSTRLTKPRFPGRSVPFPRRRVAKAAMRRMAISPLRPTSMR